MHGEEGMDRRQMSVKRKFVFVNSLLIAILFLTAQPFVILWTYVLYFNDNVDSQTFLIMALMADNILYLKFLLGPFVYAMENSQISPGT